MAGGIQTQVNVVQAPAVAGDWASGNPRTYYTAGPGGLVAGPSGLTVGAFAWLSWVGGTDPDSAPITATNFYSGFPFGAFGFGGAGGAAPTGFVHREQQGLNTTYLLDASMLIPSGFAVALATSGDIWVKNSGSGVAYPGMQAFANFANGQVTFAAAGASASTVTAATSTVTNPTSVAATGGISGNIMTISAISAGTIYAGTVITGGATGTQVTGQITPLLAGEALGGVGRYYVNIAEQSVAAGTSLTGLTGVLTLGATPSGTFPIGALVSGGTIAAGSYVTQYITGSGSANGNTMAISTTTPSTSATVTSATNIGTKWFAQSGGSAGELIKMTSYALG
jgi:hypothetical protein